jgi:DNA-binding CsgD family transcriptional regulator
VDIQTSHYVTGDTAFAIDRSGAIVLWNKAAEESLGFTAEQALGQKCWKLLSGTDSNDNRYCCKFCPLREMNFRHEPVHSFHSTFKSSTDQPKHFEVSCLTVFDEPGNEMLLHICRLENDETQTDSPQVPSWTPTTTELGTLSQRELEVLTLLAKRVRTQEIADRLSISIRTVRTHIQHVMYKLQVHKRREAIQVGKRLNLI